MKAKQVFEDFGKDKYIPGNAHKDVPISKPYRTKNSVDSNMWYQKRFGWQDVEIPEGYEFSGISTWGSGHQSPYIEKSGGEYSHGVMMVGSDKRGYELMDLSNNSKSFISVPTKQEAIDKAIDIINNKESLNEADTDHFVVNSGSKRVTAAKGTDYDYWRGENYLRLEKKTPTIDMQIDVFGSGNLKEEAQKLYDALRAAGLENNYFKIKIEVK